MFSHINFLHRTACGALVEVRPTDRHFFKLRDPDLKHKNGYFHHTMFHPGQTLVGSINALENEKWLTPKPERSHRSTKVCSICPNYPNRFFFSLDLFDKIREFLTFDSNECCCFVKCCGFFS